MQDKIFTAVNDKLIKSYYGDTRAIDPIVIGLLLQLALQMLQSCVKSNKPEKIPQIAKTHPVLSKMIIRSKLKTMQNDLHAADFKLADIDSERASSALLHLAQTATVEEINDALKPD